MFDIINLFKSFDKYQQFSDKELSHYIAPSIWYNQYKKHYHKDQLIGFTNWALISNEVEKKFIKGQSLKLTDWKSGNNIWHIETVCTMNLPEIMSWTKNNFASNYGINKTIKWAKIENNKVKSIHQVKSKESWLWAV